MDNIEKRINFVLSQPERNEKDETLISDLIQYNCFNDALKLFKINYQSKTPPSIIISHKIATEQIQNPNNFIRLIFYLEHHGFVFVNQLKKFEKQLIPENLLIIGAIYCYALSRDYEISSTHIHREITPFFPNFNYYHQNLTFFSIEFLKVHIQRIFSKYIAKSPPLQPQSSEFLSTTDQNSLKTFSNSLSNAFKRFSLDNSLFIMKQVKNLITTFEARSQNLKKQFLKFKHVQNIFYLNRIALDSIIIPAREVSKEFIEPLKNAKTIEDIKTIFSQIDEYINSDNFTSLPKFIILSELTGFIDSLSSYYPQNLQSFSEYLDNFDNELLHFEKNFEKQYNLVYNQGIKWPKEYETIFNKETSKSYHLLHNLRQVIESGVSHIYGVALQQIHKLESYSFLGKIDEEEEKKFNFLKDIVIPDLNESIESIQKLFSKNQFILTIKTENPDKYSKKFDNIDEMENLNYFSHLFSYCLVCRNMRASKICSSCHKKVCCHKCLVSSCPRCGKPI